MTGMDRKDIDLEMGVGEATLYPGLSYGENQLRWGFIRKVYGILSAQLLLTTLISAVVVLNPPVNDLLTGSSGILLFLCIVPFICTWISFFESDFHFIFLVSFYILDCDVVI